VIDKSKVEFTNLTKDFGVNFQIFHGPGGDLNRGGAKLRYLGQRYKAKKRNNRLNTPEAAQHYQETLFENCSLKKKVATPK